MASEEDFCAEMRERTKDIHDKSDRLINVKLAVVLTDSRLYADVLSDFYFIYQTIEQCLEIHSEHPNVNPLLNERMYRADAFEKDLEFYLGKGWKAQIRPSQAAGRYCDRIMHVASRDPSLLIAYVHSMYLALVAGGQILRRIIKKTLGLSNNNQGLAIFEFEDIDRNDLREHIHSAINHMDLDREKKEAIVSEKIRVFVMNNHIASSVTPSVKNFGRLSKFILLFMLVMALLSIMIALLLRYLFT